MNSSSLSLSESVNSRGFLFRLVKSISTLVISSVVLFVRVCRVPIQAVLPLVCCSDASTNTTRLRGNGLRVGVVQQWMDGWMAGVYEWKVQVGGRTSFVGGEW